MELYEQTAAKLSEMLQNKECSAVELCQSVQGRIAAVEDKVGAYVTQCEDALAQAEAVDQARAAGAEEMEKIYNDAYNAAMGK